MREVDTVLEDICGLARLVVGGKHVLAVSVFCRLWWEVDPSALSGAERNHWWRSHTTLSSGCAVVPSCEKPAVGPCRLWSESTSQIHAARRLSKGRVESQFRIQTESPVSPYSVQLAYYGISETDAPVYFRDGWTAGHDIWAKVSELGHWFNQLVFHLNWCRRWAGSDVLDLCFLNLLLLLLPVCITLHFVTLNSIFHFWAHKFYLPPLGHIWDVMLVWRKGNIEKTVSVLQ